MLKISANRVIRFSVNPGEIEHQQRQRQGGGNGHPHDARLAPAEGQPEQERHAEHGDAHVQQQFVRFFRRRFAVVAGDGDLDVGRDQNAAQGLDLPQHAFGHGDGVGPGALGHGERHGRFLFGEGLARAPRRSVAEQHVLAGFLRPVHDVGHVPQVDGLAAVHAHDHPADLLGVAEETARFDEDLAVVPGEAARPVLAVGLLQHGDESHRAEVARRQADRVEQHPHLPACAADDHGLGHFRDLLDGVVHLGHQPAQRQVIALRAVEGQRQDRHVVDGLELDERLTDAVGDAIEV
ncbi:MAG: hypothetical protein KatS3mg124_2162 [Porticoccaceae bacterium]|nr:MAG: hypothetical protein KatS3mg124_2162 [Porticoccaceae bacterium]